MLSLYVHIPFCAHKCSYCSFFVMPEDEIAPDVLELKKEEYLQSLLKEISLRQEQYGEEQIKTIYIGGGTPFQLGTERLYTLIDALLEQRDTEFLEELTIELNPDPFNEVLEFIEQAKEKYKHLYKLRFSIGIQTFDDQLLSKSKRNYHFNNLPGFLRKLQALKGPGIAFSADFIAFGKFKVDDEGTEYLRDNEKTEFFINLVKSQMFDGFSLYTLEVMPGSDWHNEALSMAKAAQKVYGNEENVIDEFHFLRKYLEYHGYRRYEISNFALRGKESIHNMVYRNHGSYLGLGINASSYLNEKVRNKYGLPKDLPQDTDGVGTRFKNTNQWKAYLGNTYSQESSIEHLSAKEHMREQAMLQLRTSGIKDIGHFTPILVENRKTLLETWEKEDLCTLEEGSLTLTVGGLNVYNRILTELFTLGE